MPELVPTRCPAIERAPRAARSTAGDVREAIVRVAEGMSGHV